MSAGEEASAGAHVLQRLRTATAPEHARVEATLDLLDPRLTVARLCATLGRLHGFWVATETQLDDWAARDPATATALDWPRRRRAHLFAADAAESLQRSLLTDPPRDGAVDTAVRYVPAAREAQVGGDWYDVFPQPDGSTALVIGDVAGHDTAAAASMAQLRGLLRGIAFDSADSPAGVLRRVDTAIEGLGLEALATVILARLEPADGEGTRMRWSSAGHLPPLVATPDGEISVLAGERADLLLGVDPAARRHDLDVLLRPGATVLLYTDGLVERRDRVLDDGIDALVAALGEVGNRPLSEVCDALLARLLPGRGEDDVALIAVRLPAGG